MKLNPYLTFDGNGAEAAAYYAQTLKGTVVSSMTFGQIPDEQSWITDHNRNRLAHARVDFSGGSIMISDTAGQEPFEGHKGMTMQLSVESMEEGQSMFDAFAADGNVRMPYGPTFWAKGFGMVQDKFGVSWMMNFE